MPIYEVGEHEGKQYYAMKFVEGTSLAKHPQGPPRREVEALLPAIRAVHHAHQRGVLHRDLKPSNILVDPQGTYSVTGDDALKLLRQARESAPPRPSSICPGLDRDLETVVLKCLEKEPSHRYASAEVFAEEPVSSARISGVVPRRRASSARGPSISAGSVMVVMRPSRGNCIPATPSLPFRLSESNHEQSQGGNYIVAHSFRA